jgi:hypothetical protein
LKDVEHKHKELLREQQLTLGQVNSQLEVVDKQSNWMKALQQEY